jgi:RNA polymerase sigma factor (sigma-70 family)
VVVKSPSNIVAYLRSLAARHGATEDNDCELLRRFLHRRDNDAFAVLMHRHGPMVLSLARRIVADEQLAEDVFQATFLLFWRKASTIRRPESLSCWLHGVAHRLARQTQRSRQRQQEREARLPPSSPPKPLDELTAQEFLSILDEELDQLPETARAPLILCCLEGLSREEAARRLNCSSDAIKGRLERGRQRLRQRLEKRGLTLPAVFGGTLLLAGTPSVVPAALMQTTLKAAINGVGTTPAVAALIQETMRMMIVHKLKTITVVGILFAFGSLGVGMMALRPQVGGECASPVAAVDDKPLSPKKHVDLYGDPLPEGAALRLGTLQRRAIGAQLAVSSDGKSIIGVRNGKYIRIWDAITGELRQQRELPVGFSINSSLLSCDGRLLVTPGERLDRLTVWDTATGKKFQTPVLEGGRLLSPRAFSPDGKSLAIVEQSPKATIRVWDLATNRERFAKQWPGVWIQGIIAFSPDGKHLLAASSAGKGIFCWDAATGRQRWHNENFDNGFHLQPAFTPDGANAIFHANSGEGLAAIDLATGKVVPTKNLPRIGWFDLLTLSPDGRTLLVSTPKGVRVWDVKEGKERRLLAEAGEQVAFLPDGKSIVSNNGSLQRWDVATGKPLWSDTFAWGHVGVVGTLAFSADGKRLVSGSTDGTVRLWDAATGKPLHTWRAHQAARFYPNGCQSGSGVSATALSAEGRWILSGGLDERLQLWDVSTGKSVRSIPLPQRQQNEGYRECFQVRFTSDATKGIGLFVPQTGFVAADGKMRYRLQLAAWDLDKGTLLENWPVELNQLLSFALSEDGRMAMVDRALWDAASGRRLHQLEEGEKDERPPFCGSSYVFLRDGALVAGSFERDPSNNGRPMSGVRVWETASGKPISLVGSPNHRLCGFHPNGRFLAVGDNTDILLWDIAKDRQVFRWKMPEGANRLAFTPDGRRLAAAAPDGDILIWNTPLPPRKSESLSVEQLDHLWTDLADADAAKAWRAVWRVADAPKDALAFLRGRVKPYPTAPAETTRKLLADLDSDSFELREAAGKRLKELGLQAEPALRAALKAKPSLEQRRRIEPILTALTETPEKLSAENLRQLRALIVLKRIGTPEARRMLENVAKGPESAALTRQARAALACLP